MASRRDDVVMTIRVPRTIAERIKDLRSLVEAERAFVMKSKVTRSDLVRYTLLKGIETLEKRARGLSETSRPEPSRA